MQILSQLNNTQRFWSRATKSRHSLAKLINKFEENDAGEALFALQMIESLYSQFLPAALEKCIHFPSDVVKIFVVKKIEELKIDSMQANLEALVQNESQPKIVRNSCLITLFALGKGREVAGLEMGYVFGLFRYGKSHHEKEKALEITQIMLSSQQTNQVCFALEMIGRFRLSELYDAVLPFFEAEHSLKLSAIKTAGKVGYYQPFVAPLLKEIGGDVAFRQAIEALANFGEAAIQAMRAEFGAAQDSIYLSRLLRVCGKIPGKSEGLLLGLLRHKNLKAQILHTLKLLNFKAKDGLETRLLQDEMETLLSFCYVLLQSVLVLERQRPRYDLLVQAIFSEYQSSLKSLAEILYFLMPLQSPPPGEDSELYIKENLVKCAALELLLNKKLKILVAEDSLAKKTQELSQYFHFPLNSDVDIIAYIIKEDSHFSSFGSWTKTVALESLAAIESPSFLKQILALLDSKNESMSRAAFHLLQKTANQYDMKIQEFLEQITPVPALRKFGREIYQRQLLDTEKVIILKRTELFAQTPENILIDIAKLTREVRFRKDETIFEKGMAGDCMYVIYEGQVKIHVGGYVLTTLINGDFFGELGLLDSGQRSANATCEADTLLLRIDQEDFYELTESRPEVAKGVIKALCEIIRNQSQSIENLKTSNSKANKTS
jgi:hypothetical protein